MDAANDVLTRIDEIEGELRELSAELRELRGLVTQTVVAPAPEVTHPVGPEQRFEEPVAFAAAPPGARLEAAIASARIHLSEGRRDAALDELERAIAFSRTDPEELQRLETVLDGIARYEPAVRTRARALAETARLAALEVDDAVAQSAAAGAAPPEAAPAAPAVAPGVPEAPPSPPSSSVQAKPARPSRTIANLARDWDLLGPRGFAIIGGAVTAFGIILLFVLAANRGWITPTMRVAFGACVSAAAVGAGFWVRSRYGQMQMSLGAVGAGIAGGYATLAAAAARYDLVPDWLALPLAGGLAALAVVIAVAWSSETVAAIGLLGSALAPALQAIDTGLTWPAAAFAVIILAATVTLAVPRRWQRLLIGIAVVVGAQVAWLAADSDHAAGAGTTAVVAAFVLVVLAAGIWLQLTAARTDLDPLATSFLLAAVGLALLLVRPLYEIDRDRGLALAAGAAIWAVAWAVTRVRQPSLGLVLGVSSLSLAAVATADLLSGTGLAITWAAEALLLSWIASRLRDARLQATALAYCLITAAHVLLVDAPPRLVFDDPVPGVAAASVAALAFALIGTGVLTPAETVARTDTGLLAWIATVRSWLVTHRVGLQEGLLFGGAVAATYAVAILFIAHSFRPGHLAAAIVASAVGACVAAVSARRGSKELVVGSLIWLGGVFAIAAGFDVPEFAVDAVHRSYGGWALIAASAGVLAGCFAFQLLFPHPGPPAVPLVGGVAALVGSTVGIALISPVGDVFESAWTGWRLLAPTLVFVALSAGVFRLPRHRDLATVMWALGAVALLGSEWLVIPDATWRAVAYSVTATVLALLARPLRERRLWLAGWGVACVTASFTVTVLAAIWLFDGAEPARYAIAALGIAAALAVICGLAWGEAGRRDLVTVAWATGLLSLILGEAFLLDGGSSTVFAWALTSGALALLSGPLQELRVWWGGVALVSVTSAAVLALITPPSHFLAASASPGEGLWVGVGCLAAGVALHVFGTAYRRWIDPIVAVGALYLLSLAILELAERAFGGSVETDFERGHVAVSMFWALIGLALLVAGLIRDQALLRYGGLSLFGLSLGKIFLYDLSALSSAARALSFIAVGALVLAGGFFLQRLSSRLAPRRPRTP